MEISVKKVVRLTVQLAPDEEFVLDREDIKGDVRPYRFSSLSLYVGKDYIDTTGHWWQSEETRLSGKFQPDKIMQCSLGFEEVPRPILEALARVDVEHHPLLFETLRESGE